MKFFENEKYIKMCEGAEEIQKEYKIPKEGDFISLKSGIDVVLDYRYEENELIVICDEEYKLDTEYKKDEFTFLPRLDQYRDIMEEDDLTWIVEGQTFARQFIVEGEEFPFSAEEIALMRYMKEKHNKYWNESEWVDSKTYENDYFKEVVGKATESIINKHAEVQSGIADAEKARQDIRKIQGIKGAPKGGKLG